MGGLGGRGGGGGELDVHNAASASNTSAILVSDRLASYYCSVKHVFPAFI